MAKIFCWSEFRANRKHENSYRIMSYHRRSNKNKAPAPPPKPVGRAGEEEPSELEVSMLSPGQYFAWGNRYFVQASRVDKARLCFWCPFCEEEHEHGSNGNREWRREHRSPHCFENNVSFFIDVTPNTEGSVPPQESSSAEQE